MPQDETSSDGLLSFLWRHKIWWMMPAISVLLIRRSPTMMSAATAMSRSL